MDSDLRAQLKRHMGVLKTKFRATLYEDKTYIGELSCSCQSSNSMIHIVTTKTELVPIKVIHCPTKDYKAHYLTKPHTLLTPLSTPVAENQLISI